MTEPREPGAADDVLEASAAETGSAEAADTADAVQDADTENATDVPADDSAGEPADADEPAGEQGADEPDHEGPRRKARREREERRAAQARAIAIENARREAKRKVAGKPLVEAKRPPRGLIRGLKALLWSALISVAAVGMGLLLYFTPIMAARSVVITGLTTISQEEVEQASAIMPDTPLLQINTDAVAERVATIRRVASARVQREYPSTLRITIVERIPVVVKDYPDGPHLFDRDGVDFATATPPLGLPYLDAENPGPSDAPTKAALQVLLALRPEVVGQVSRIAAPSVASITLTLFDGREVIWGTTDRTEEKALKLGALLTQPGRTYDVSSPDLPTVK